MRKIFVVVDTDTQRAVRACKSENRADEYADEYYESTNHDSRVDEVWLDETNDEPEEEA